MSVKTVLLGLLRKGPLYGYELKQIIERDMGDWTNIAFGSIYFALDKLAKDGFVTARTEDGSNNRPARIVYTITPAGEAEYLVFLRKLWTDEKRHYDDFDIAIAFMKDLPVSEVRRYLAERIARQERALAFLETHEKETMNNPAIPKQARFIFSHTRCHIQAELDWARNVLSGL